MALGERTCRQRWDCWLEFGRRPWSTGPHVTCTFLSLNFFECFHLVAFLSPSHIAVFSFGMGVDQVVEVELVGADGSLIVANGELPNIWDKNYVASKGNGTSVTSADGLQTEESEDTSLFWALRGGGAGPWGVVTALTIRLHKPRLFFSSLVLFGVLFCLPIQRGVH